MPAQPLTSFRNVQAFTFVPGSVFMRPALAPHVLKVIEYWAFAEWNILRIGASCLHGDLRVATEMLQAIDSQAGQRAAILAAAKTVLDAAHWPLFEAAFLSTLASRAVRNKFAHHLWGTSADLPEALLLQDVKNANSELAKRMERVFQRIAEGVGPAAAVEHVGTIDRSGIFVWRQPDLETEVANAARANFVMANLERMIDRFRAGQPTDSIRTQLLSDPITRQRFDKASNQASDAVPQSEPPQDGRKKSS